MKLWKKIKDYISLTYTDKEEGKRFLTFIFILGGIGLLFCIAWFVLLVKEGMPIGCIIFNIALFLFLGWAIVVGIVKPAKKYWSDDERDIFDKDSEDETL